MRLFLFFVKNGLYLALIHACISTAYVMADDDSMTISGKTYQWIENSRRYVGSGVKKMTGSVDSYLSRNKAVVENDSYIRLRLGYVLEEGGHTFPNNDIKLKVDLPKTKNKWALVFETNPDEFETLEQQHQDNKTQQQAFQGSNSSIGAMKFILGDWQYWKNDFDVGIKMPFPANPFVRFNTKRRYQMSELWSSRIKHSIYYFREEKLGEHSSVMFERPIVKDWTFFNAVDMQWQSQGDILEYSDIVMFQQILTDRDTFLYRTGEFYQQHPSPHLQSYFIDTVYRRRLHHDWLFLDTIPSVTWSEDHHFHGIFALTLRLEVIFN